MVPTMVVALVVTILGHPGPGVTDAFACESHVDSLREMCRTRSPDS